ncbi:MAG: helix-turn-helix transcriptional regulator [Clostridium sp.]
MNKLINFESLDEFKKMGFILLENNILNNTIDNMLQEILIAKRITISELSRMTGVSKQVISKSITNNSKIGLDSAIKISSVLETPVEKIFKLNENAWIDVYIVEGQTVYLNMKTLKMIINHEKNEYINSTGMKYFNPVTNELSSNKLNSDYKELFVQVGRKVKPYK